MGARLRRTSPIVSACRMQRCECTSASSVGHCLFFVMLWRIEQSVFHDLNCGNADSLDSVLGVVLHV